MNRKALFALVALTLGSASIAQAQSSWYIAPRVGAVIADNSRGTDDSLYTGIGAGAWVTPNLAVDFEYGINNADFKSNSFRSGHEWETVTLGVSGRWFFGTEGSAWRPYVMGGLLAARHQAYSGSVQHDGWDPGATVGGGVQYNASHNVAIRFELAARYDKDNNSLRGQVGPGGTAGFENHFVDGLATVGLVYTFGAAPAAPVVEEQAPPPPPPVVEEQPEPTAVVIDLRGINFKFDRPRKSEHNIAPTLREPTADSIAILDQAADVLQRNPNVKVQIQGHTDSVGTDAYNMGLSDRRAQIVNDYLLAHGVSASQITGVQGFGESQPIDTNATKEGRARNRRVELPVQQ